MSEAVDTATKVAQSIPEGFYELVTYVTPAAYFLTGIVLIFELKPVSILPIVSRSEVLRYGFDFLLIAGVLYALGQILTLLSHALFFVAPFKILRWPFGYLKPIRLPKVINDRLGIQDRTNEPRTPRDEEERQWSEIFDDLWNRQNEVPRNLWYKPKFSQFRRTLEECNVRLRLKEPSLTTIHSKRYSKWVLSRNLALVNLVLAFTILIANHFSVTGQTFWIVVLLFVLTIIFAVDMKTRLDWYLEALLRTSRIFSKANGIRSKSGRLRTWKHAKRLSIIRSF